MKRVRLEWYEILQGAHVGVMRKVECIRQGKKDAHGAHYERDWTVDIEGAIAEVAAAKALGMFYSGSINTWKQPDLGRNIQVRYCRRNNGHDPHMVIRPSDKDDEIFVLVSAAEKPEEYIVHGWIQAKEAKAHDEWISYASGRPKCWRVPASALKQFDPWLQDCLVLEKADRGTQAFV